MYRFTRRYQSTIYALSTGWGKSAISIIRVSGPEASEALALARTKSSHTIKPRHAYFKTFFDIHRDPPTPIDKGILLYFREPNSYTGEDMLEM